MNAAARLVLATCLVVWCALVVLILAACGGATSPQAAPALPAATNPPPPEQTAPSAPPASSAAHPSQDASSPDTAAAPALAWVALWREPWADLALGGWVRHSGLRCNGNPADPDLPPEGSFAAGHAWSVFGTVSGQLEVRGGALHVDSYQHAGGYALLSGRTWPTDRPLAVETTVDLRADPYAWIGVTLIADETDYRELALYERGGRIHAGVWHPCMVEWSIGNWEPGPRTLRLEYTPAGPVCWRHYVDGALLSSERCSVPGAPLVSPARVGIYVVNLLAEGQRVPGQVRAAVGPVTVEGAR